MRALALPYRTGAHYPALDAALSYGLNHKRYVSIAEQDGVAGPQSGDHLEIINVNNEGPFSSLGRNRDSRILRESHLASRKLADANFSTGEVLNYGNWFI